MQTIADLYNGRIVIVNSSYKIMTDTFNRQQENIIYLKGHSRCFGER